MLVLPIPAVIKEVATGGFTHTEIDWRWLPLRDPVIGAAKAMTFASYEVMAGPLLFMSFFLATAAEIRPMTRRGRVLYAVLIGLYSALLQMYVSVAYGPYIALLMISLLTPLFDRYFKPRSLV
jgi:Na+-translocating ferredoxin:NAD+ oxidoreductase RnfD subunit